MKASLLILYSKIMNKKDTRGLPKCLFKITTINNDRNDSGQKRKRAHDRRAEEPYLPPELRKYAAQSHTQAIQQADEEEKAPTEKPVYEDMADAYEKGLLNPTKSEEEDDEEEKDDDIEKE